MSAPETIGLIPARMGSKRVPGLNLRRFCGLPLLACAIASALQSGVFSEVIVSTESAECAEVAKRYGASVPFLRPAEFAADLSPDIQWVDFTLRELKRLGRQPELFALLRPTSPFRSAATIRRAHAQFVASPWADSLRAMEPCAQHPGKMWVVRGSQALPLLPLSPAELPWHSRPYQDLPLVHVQNASLEIARCAVVLEAGTISGHAVLPFFTEGHEGLDITPEHDWERAEALVLSGAAALPLLDAAKP